VPSFNLQQNTRIILLAGLILLPLPSQGQTTSFETASIHPNKDGEGGRDRIEPSPSRLTMLNTSLFACVSWAYHLQRYQLAAPGWLEDERFDISATATSPVKEEDLRLMLRALLRDRFGLAVHVEKRSLGGFELAIARGGIKMKEVEADRPPNFRGLTIMVGDHATMDQLAEFLSIPLRGPVVDATGLTGRYDFKVDLHPYLKLDRIDKQADPVQEIIATFGIAMEENLGLRINRKKVQADVTVVDRIEKTSTEN
jgi:uncharacterized protein (TIGR03435 family)